MSNTAAFFIGGGIALGLWFVAQGLDSIGDAIRRLGK